MGRNAAGVIGLKFKKAGDELVACDIDEMAPRPPHHRAGIRQAHVRRRVPDQGPGRYGRGRYQDRRRKGPVVGTLSTTMMKFSRSPAKAS